MMSSTYTNVDPISVTLSPIVVEETIRSTLAHRIEEINPLVSTQAPGAQRWTKLDQRSAAELGAEKSTLAGALRY